MKDLLLSIVFLALLKMLFEEARIFSWITRLVHLLVYAGVILISHFVTQHLSLPRFEGLLNTPQALRDLALFVMVDLFIVLYTATFYVMKGSREWMVRSDIPLGTSKMTSLPLRQSTTWGKIGMGLKRIPLYSPSLLFLPVLFYVRLMLFYAFPGESFLGVTAIFILVVALLTFFSPYIMSLVVEVKKAGALSQGSITLSFITFLLVIAAGVLHPDSRISGGGTSVANWRELLLLFIVVLSGAVVGFLITLYCEKKRNKKNSQIKHK